MVQELQTQNIMKRFETIVNSIKLKLFYKNLFHLTRKIDGPTIPK